MAGPLAVVTDFPLPVRASTRRCPLGIGVGCELVAEPVLCVDYLQVERLDGRGEFREVTVMERTDVSS
jgi:hypothetical protein